MAKTRLAVVWCTSARPFWGDPKAERSNHQISQPDDLTGIFESLADWEHQLKSLPPEDLKYLKNEVEEPTS